MSKSKTVYIGLSGGVDSAVSAFLLKQSGYEVIGVFLKTWQPDYIECTWKEDRLDAIRVCANLDIPFIMLDAEKQYKEHVVNYMIDSYKEGLTPNPDIMCNKYIKFKILYDYARENNAYMATGHYAKTDGYNLYIPHDKNKDQTYFLYQIEQDKLKHVLFPLQDLNKDEVRTLAKQHNLYVHNKKDSQGICMLGDIDIKDFLIKEIGSKDGDILDMAGNIIGTHRGAILYTLGESGIDNNSKNKNKLYVIKKDLIANTITLGELNDLEFDNNITLIQVNSFDNIIQDKTYKAMLRYRGAKIACNVEEISGSTIKIKLHQANVYDRGQSVVIYDGDKVLCGGIIS